MAPRVGSVVGDDLSAVPTAESLVGRHRYVLADELDRTVAEQEVATAGVGTAERE